MARQSKFVHEELLTVDESLQQGMKPIFGVEPLMFGIVR
jgi:hypothetical protein